MNQLKNQVTYLTYKIQNEPNFSGVEANSVLITDASKNLISRPYGLENTVLTSNGTTSTPSWSAGSSGNYATLNGANDFTATNYYENGIQINSGAYMLMEA
jgi:hypothetical protein